MRKLNIQKLAACGLVVATGCVGNSSFEPATRQSMNESLIKPPAAAATASSILEIRDTAGKVLYQQSNPGSTLTLQRGYLYKACFQSPNSSTSIVLKSNGSTVASGPSNQCHDLNLVGASPANVPLELVSSSPGMLSGTQKYTLSITCQTAEVANMSAAQYVSGINVSLSGAPANVYSYKPVGGNLGGADCAIDFNGDQIIDSEFKPCTQAQTGYSNHVGSRKLRIFVRERVCNYPLSASHTVTLPASPPSDPPFIHGHVRQVDSKTAKSSLNLEHMSTNADGNRAVSCGYANGVLSIQGTNKYAVRRGSGAHGISLTFKGLTGSMDSANVATTANTKLSGFEFRTDHEIDVVGSQPLVFAGNDTQCTGTLSVQNIEVIGDPCGGKADPAKENTLLAEGTFSCSNVSDSTGQHRINSGPGAGLTAGKFACTYSISSGCPGGGGGGGGVPPSPF